LVVFTQKKIASWVERKLQALPNSGFTARRQLGQDIQAENAMKPPDESGLNEIHVREGHQITQARLYEEMIPNSREVFAD
jgi:hypothetical protein